MADVAFAVDPFAVLQLGPEAYVHIGGGHHLTLHRQHAAGGGDRRFQVAGDRAEGRQEQVAEAVALQAAAGGEAVLEQSGEQGLFRGERRQTVADITRGKNAQFPAQHAAAAAVIRHRDDGGDAAAVALQAAQQCGQAGAAADRHDVGTAVEAAFGPQGIHQHCVFIGCQGLLNGAEAAVLTPEHQAAADQQHQGAGDFPGQHRGDQSQEPAHRLQNPVDRLEVGPHRRPQHGQQKSEP